MLNVLSLAVQAPTSAPAPWTSLRVAVLVPCYNEALTIAKVVRDFRLCLPKADIYVYDNGSTDGTAARAHETGAIVRREVLQGKGHVIRRMFADVEADVYVLVDGDATYDAAAAPEMMRLLIEDGLDMVSGIRVEEDAGAYRPGHRIGNRVLTGMVRQIFGDRIRDVLSGYRLFSRRFVKSFPALATGFETEIEFTVHALELRMPIGEVKTRYGERPVGSASKLHTIRDGIRILRTLVVLVKEERPLQFFLAMSLLLLMAGFALGIPVVFEFLHTGLVPRLPTALLALGFVLLSFLCLLGGLILDSVCLGRRELKRMAYLAMPRVVS
jgi:glycosyltransferase involved in cell wall biosynthesis